MTISPLISANPLLLLGLTLVHWLNDVPVPSKRAFHGAVATNGAAVGNTLLINMSAVRRPSATPVSIGLGDPMVGKSAGPAT